MIRELPLTHRYERDEPEETEQVRVTVSLNSTKLVALALSVTLEMGAGDEIERFTV